MKSVMMLRSQAPEQLLNRDYDEIILSSVVSSQEFIIKLNFQADMDKSP